MNVSQVSASQANQRFSANTDAGIRDWILGRDLDEILEDLENNDLAPFPEEVRRFLLDNKRIEIIRARVLETVTEMPVYDPVALVHRIVDYLPDAFGSDRVSFSEYLGCVEETRLRRESDAPLKHGHCFRNRFGEFSNPEFVKAARERTVVKGKVSPDKRSTGRYRTDSFMVVPLVVEERVVGVFSFADKTGDSGYGRLDQEETERFIRTLGNTLSDKMEKSHDGLTGLLNRTHFVRVMSELITHSLETSSPLSVFYVDMDHFKDVNDTWGHSAGDAVLRDLASILKSMVRSTAKDQDLVARMGGEEFAIALPVDRAAAIERGKILLARLREHEFPFAGHKTGSVGLFVYDPVEHGELSVDEILKRADQAMYHRKEHGRDGLTLWVGPDQVEAID